MLLKNYITRKMIDFNTFKKLPKNVGDLGKFIVGNGFKKLPKVQYIAQSGHTDDFKICIEELDVPIEKF